jgi:hypothetical protein
LKDISDSWRKIGAIGSPEESNGIDSSRLGTDPDGRRFNMVEISRGGWCNTLLIGIPG